MAASGNLVGKRKRKTASCPNPLFQLWLTEWRDNATAKNMKSQYTYARALRALKKYPARLESGKECKFLENFGDKTCKMLDDKLARYIEEYGTTEPVPGYLDKPENGRRRGRAGQRDFDDLNFDDLRVPLPPANGGTVLQVDDGAYLYLDEFSVPAAPDAQNVAPPRRRRQTGERTRTEREYIPQYRSGPYAIILTLFSNSDGPDRSMTKQDLMHEAQSLADTSFTVPDPGSRYTAWSSMGTLIKKGFVLKESSPAKYRLTDSGQALAARMLDAEKNGQFHVRESLPSEALQDNTNVNFDDITLPQMSRSHESGLPRHTHPEMPGTSYGPTSSSGQSKDLNRNQNNFSNRNVQTSMDMTSEIGGKRKGDYREPVEPVPKKPRHMPKSSLLSKTVENNNTIRTTNGVRHRTFPSKSSLNEDSQGSSTASQVLSLTDDSQASNSIRTTPQEPDFVLSPGTFEIVLCVDNSEVFGNANERNKLVFVKELEKHKVPHHVRPMNVGDFCWVAREKIPNNPKEIVLDYIIERKRMDDLAGSIIDGRFKEQKFRLKNCGLAHPIYLVEDYGSSQHYSIGQDALFQAIANTQITDGFYVKRTSSTKESAAYLTLMTRYIQTLHSNKYLCAVPKCSKQASTKNSLTDNTVCLLSFDEFNKASVKTKSLTVREMFGKQLCQLKGMTADKAVAILDRYPTISSVMNAYSSCVMQSQKEKLLANIKFGASRRNIGAAISKSVYYLYNTRGGDL